MGFASRFLAGDARTRKANANILASFAVKGWDVAVYFLLVPLTLGYLNEYEYGIWLTLNSILMWINSFDIGLGNGLRNKLAEALAGDERENCRIYVSTAFFMLWGLVAVMIMLGALSYSLLDWYALLNVSAASVAHLNEIVFISFVLFCLNFVFKFIGNVYQALQLPAVSNLLVCLGHTLSLLIIFVLTHLTDGTLFHVAVAYSAAPPLVYIIAYPFTFMGRYRFMAPSIGAFRTDCVRSLLSMGVLFFVIQLGGLLLFSTANVVISHLFGPENVTPYNITQRYFSVVWIGMGIVLAPIWSASTDAYVRGDIEWIKKTMRKLHRVMALAFLGVLAMIAASDFVYGLWLGGGVAIPFEMTIAMGCYTVIIVWSLAYSNFLNGMGKLRLQSWNTIIVGVLFVPLSVLLGSSFGLYGVVVALCVANLSGAVLNTVQFNKLIYKGVKDGLWSE